MLGYEGGDECPACVSGKILGDADGHFFCNSCDREFVLVNDEWTEKTDD